MSEWTEERFADLKKELVQEHRCHAVILYGSRARGDWSPESDWDVAGVREEGESFRIARPWHGSFLDAFVYPESAFEPFEAELLKLLGGRLLHDEKGFGAALLSRVEAFYRAGPAPRPEWETQMQRVWFIKTLARIQRDNPEAHLRRGWLLMEALENYFLFRGDFYLGPKQGLAWLREHDPAMFASFERALKPSADLSHIQSLVAQLLARPEKGPPSSP